ncbi:MAG: hypothetical protein AB1801_13095 [Chloroflexota bacterium]
MISKIVYLGNFYSKIKVHLANIPPLKPFLAVFSRGQKQQSKVYETWVINIAKKLLPWRWPLLALQGLAVITVELEEHLPESARLATYLFEFDFIREVTVFGLLLPLVGGITLEMFVRLQSDRRDVVRPLHRQQELNRPIAGPLEWDELTNLLVKFPSTIAPFTGIFLLIYNQARTELELAAGWQDPAGQALSPALSPTPSYCPSCIFTHSNSKNILAPCYCTDNPAISQPDNYYCMPLVQDNLSVALLHFCLPAHISLTSDQVAVLNNLAPALALALDNLRSERLNAHTATED